MSYIYKSILAGLFFVASVSFGQTDIGIGATKGELVRAVAESKRANVYQRNEFDIERQKFFAKRDQHRIVSIDVEQLEEKGAILTFTPFPGRPIKILSHGITRDPNIGFHTGVFHGEVIPPGWEKEDTSIFPVEWVVTTWSVDNDGNHILPARNHRRLKELMEQQGDVGVFPEEAYMRRHETLVHGVTGEIKDFAQGGIIRFSPLRNNRDSMFLIESDPAKEWDGLSGDSGFVELSPDRAAERKRRGDKYMRHVEALKQRLGIQDNEIEGAQND